MTDRPLVSSDLKARPESLAIAAPQVQVMGQVIVRIFLVDMTTNGVS